MASILGLSWSTTEELISDVDLDWLYEIQLAHLGGRHPELYPYAVLVHTGKITISINLDRLASMTDLLGSESRDQANGDDPFAWPETVHPDA
jgi:hypothetical protein